MTEEKRSGPAAVAGWRIGNFVPLRLEGRERTREARRGKKEEGLICIFVHLPSEAVIHLPSVSLCSMPHALCQLNHLNDPNDLNDLNHLTNQPFNPIQP